MRLRSLLPVPLRRAEPRDLALRCAAVACCALFACGSSARWRLHATPPAIPDTLPALQARFYAAGDLAGLQAAFAEAEAQAPGSAAVLEMAAYRAELLGLPHVAHAAFRDALRDPAAQVPGLYLREALATQDTHEELRALMRAVRTLGDDHPDAAVRAAALQVGARLMLHVGDSGGAQRAVRDLGLLAEVLLVGGFDNDQGKGFDADYPPEQGIDPEAEYQGMLLPVRWRATPPRSFTGLLDLRNLLSPESWNTAYVATWVHAPAAGRYELRLLSTDAFKVWVGQALVASEQHVAGGAPDGFVIPIELKAGANAVLIKSCQAGGSWKLGLRLTRPSGAPATELRASIAAGPPVRRDATAKAPHDGTAELRRRLAGVPDPVRRLFLHTRLADRLGLDQERLESAQALLEAAPGSLLARFQAARAFWDAGQQGRTMDLLGELLRAPDAPPGVLAKRGRLYRQKGFRDKALDDLRAARAAIGADDRWVAIELDAIYDDQGWPADRCTLAEEVLARWPRWSWALQSRAECLSDQGLHGPATATLRQALELEPGNSAVLRELRGLALRRADYARALLYARRAASLHPERTEPLLAEGAILERLLRDSEALAAYRRAGRLDPQWSKPWQRVGDLHYKRGRRAEALSAWSEALRLDPDAQALAEHMEFVEPAQLELLQRWQPDDAEIERLLAARGEVQRLPGASVIYLLDHEITQVSADSTVRRVVTQVATATDEAGRDSLMRWGLPRGGRFTLLHAYAVDPTGHRSEAASIRDRTVRFRNLAVGSTVVLQFRHYARQSGYLRRFFFSSWSFQGRTRQFERSRWDLLLEQGTELLVDRQGPVAEEREQVEGFDHVVFHAEHVPPLPAEPNSPPDVDILARVNVGTLPRWEEYVHWEFALLSRAFQTDARIKALVERLLADAGDDPAKRLAALQRFVTRDVRYQKDYEDSIAGVRPHPAAETLTRRYGDCKDKSVLLVTMAREAGIEARFTLVRTRGAGRLLRDLPQQQFNHAIVYLPPQPGFPAGRFLDTTADGLDLTALRQDVQGATALVLDPTERSFAFVDIPLDPPALHSDRHRATVLPSFDGPAQVQLESEFTGVSADFFRRRLRNDERGRKAVEAFVDMLFPGAQARPLGIDGHQDLTGPLRMSFALRAPSLVRVDRGELRVRPPDFLGLDHLVPHAQRANPLRLGTPRTASLTLTLALGTQLSAAHVPPDTAIETPCLRLHRTATPGPEQLEIVYELVRTCYEISVADYPAFRAAAQQVSRALEEEIVLRPVTSKR